MSLKAIQSHRTEGFSQAVIDETSGVVKVNSANTILVPTGTTGPAQTTIANGEVLDVICTVPLTRPNDYTYDNFPEAIDTLADDTYIYNPIERAWLEFTDKSLIASDDLFYREKTWIRIDLFYTRNNDSSGQLNLARLRNSNPASSLNLSPWIQAQILPQGSLYTSGRTVFLYPMTMDEFSHLSNSVGGGYIISVSHDGNGLTNCQSRVEIFR